MPTEPLPTYTEASPPTPSADELRARIPGWGVDLDPADRPSYPKLGDFRDQTGAHWELPEPQPGSADRERSVEHAFVTPVFGTAQPRRGLSGRLRHLAYARWSEARNAHWLTLMAADRVDVLEGAVETLVHGHRADGRQRWLDPLVVLGPWVLGAAGAAAVVRRARR